MASSTLAELRIALAQRSEYRPGVASTGIPALNRILPEGGWKAGSLIEWLADPGAGACDLAFRTLASVSDRGLWCLVDPERTVYPWGGFDRSCLIVRPSNTQEVWWTVEQALRCPGVAVTWCSIDSVPDRVLRRWQLAAEAGGGIGMLFRPRQVIQQRAWSDVRLAVTPVVRSSRCSRTVRVEVVSCRGRLGGQAVMLELHHAPDTVCLVSELDDSTLAADRSQFTLRCVGRVG